MSPLPEQQGIIKKLNAYLQSRMDRPLNISKQKFIRPPEGGVYYLLLKCSFQSCITISIYLVRTERTRMRMLLYLWYTSIRSCERLLSEPCRILLYYIMPIQHINGKCKLIRRTVLTKVINPYHSTCQKTSSFSSISSSRFLTKGLIKPLRSLILLSWL